MDNHVPKLTQMVKYMILIAILQLVLIFSPSISKTTSTNEIDDVKSRGRTFNESWLLIKHPSNDEMVDCTDVSITVQRNPESKPGSVFLIFVDGMYVTSASLPLLMPSSSIGLRPLKPGKHVMRIFCGSQRPPLLLDEVAMYTECRDLKHPFSEPLAVSSTVNQQCGADAEKADDGQTRHEQVYLVSKIPPLALNPVMPDLRGQYAPIHARPPRIAPTPHAPAREASPRGRQ
jgi:hypothetical protein